MYPVHSFPDVHGSDPEDHLRLVNALLSVIWTASPSAHHQLVSQPGEHSGLTHAHTHTTFYPPDVQNQTPSLNIAWLRDALSHGLPFSLTQHLFFGNVAKYGYTTAQNQPSFQLAACLGFHPVPAVEAEATSTSDSSPSSPSRKKRPATNSSEDQTAGLQDMSESAQRLRARGRARPRTFSMHYLSRRRNWGPYLAVLPRAPNERDCSLGIPTLEASPDDFVSDSDSDADADYIPPDDATVSASSATPEPGPQPPSTGPGTLPTAEQLHPDWAWLTAARIVAECKLRQHVDPENIAKLEDWDNLRQGAWVPEAPRPRGADDSTTSETLAQVHPEESVSEEKEWKKHEWDWAGAEGIWRSVLGVLPFPPLISI